jgi:hypothetical protein
LAWGDIVEKGTWMMSMDETIPKLPFLPDAYHYAIAAVAARSAQLDHIIPLAMVGLLGSVPQGISRVFRTCARGRRIKITLFLNAGKGRT